MTHAAALGLYPPLQTLKPVAPEVWLVDGPAMHMHLLGAELPFPTRMVVVRLAGGGLWLHSPVALSDSLREEVDALGQVQHLVSPNKLHYAHIAAWQRAYPQALAWASSGVRERAADHGITLHFDADLHDLPPDAWAGEIDQLVFRGSRFLDEVVFFHRASATLVLADLIENFEPARTERKMRWLAALGGATDPDGKAPVDLRLTFWGHHDDARHCLQRLLAWAPERVLLAHGRWYERDGVAELRRAFRWLD
ncbi:MAG: DUF4336 domain-containing protein [Rhizobacter sp.]|nr:DUF4336 domain-containing protein [Rhizobacter sp.]